MAITDNTRKVTRESRVISKAELIRVHEIMSFHRRTSGYFGLVADRIQFFDSKPSDNILAAPLTIDQLEHWIKDYDNETKA